MTVHICQKQNSTNLTFGLNKLDLIKIKVNYRQQYRQKSNDRHFTNYKKKSTISNYQINAKKKLYQTIVISTT